MVLNRALEQHRYGGLAKRYKKHRKGMLGCLDPMGATPVTFSVELEYENWLLYWLDPGVTQLDSSRRPWSCLDKGIKRTLQPHLAVYRADGIELQVVCRHDTELPSVLAHSYERVALAHGARFALRTRAQIRASVQLLSNLKLLRQRWTIHRNEALDDLSNRVVGLLQQEAQTVGTLRAAMQQDTQDQRIDAVLARLCRAGLVSINLQEASYGDHTPIRTVRSRDRLPQRT